ncbi:TlpA disulfide reductase family protein [Congregibacter brevis]|uniref:TlpA disulfide reductase family protein n=1 Tax=Congregibacter brevis TaxID=3081201 RepID=A0ABZ0IBW3_9GAMM|nr:TlpA disulfide reductase family protein [Congregibacter sp. IMCC45268]
MRFLSGNTLQILLLLVLLNSATATAQQADVHSGVWRVVNYWSEWCSPCRKEIPMLNALSKELDPDKVRVFGVNFDDAARQETLKTAKALGIVFPTLSKSDVAALGLRGPDVMPTTYIVSPDNEVAAKLVGLQSRTQVLEELSRLGLAPESPLVTEVMSPAPVNSHLPRLTSNNGDLYLSWVTDLNTKSRLSYAKLGGALKGNGKGEESEEGWSPPLTISEGGNWFINWADFPALSVSVDGMVAHWLQRSGVDTYDYDIAASFFDVEQQQWSIGKRVNTDGIKAEHGFVSMTSVGDQGTLITWLDGRNTKRQPTPGAMTLRSAVFDYQGKNLEEWELDEAVCDCCQTSSAMTPKGPVVVYRNRTSDEIRDIFIVRMVDGSWSQPQAVHDDGWQVNGCPVNGPAVAAKGGRLAVAWFTAKSSEPKVQLALSANSGETFSAPILVSASNTNGRVDTTILENGEILVSWMDNTDSNAKIMLSRYSSNGDLRDVTEVGVTGSSRRSGFPVIESVGDIAYVAWTDVTDERQVRLAKVVY